MRPHRPVAGGRDLVLPGDGVRLAATRWHGSGTPVVLLHGLASQRRFWNLVVPGLAGLPVVAWDQRGHGESGNPTDGYRTSSIVADVATALDALGLSRAVVVGHSWGGAVALSFAATHPERTLAVVAVDGGLQSLQSSHSSQAEVRRALAPPRIAVPPDRLPAMLAAGELAPWWSPAVEGALLPIFGVDDSGLARARLAYDDHLAVLDALWEYDPAAAAAGVRCPVWAVIARPLDTRDAATADRAEAAAALAARCLVQPRVVILAGAVHDVPLQWPALISGIVRAAVDEVSGEVGA